MQWCTHMKKKYFLAISLDFGLYYISLDVGITQFGSVNIPMWKARKLFSSHLIVLIMALCVSFYVQKHIVVKSPAQITLVAARVAVTAVAVGANHPALVAAAAVKKAARRTVYMGTFPHQRHPRVQTEAQLCA